MNFFKDYLYYLYQNGKVVLAFSLFAILFSFSVNAPLLAKVIENDYSIVKHLAVFVFLSPVGFIFMFSVSRGDYMVKALKQFSIAIIMLAILLTLTFNL